MLDKVFITNLPAFYKIKLFNEIAKRQDIKVIFLEKTGVDRLPDFYDEPIMFSYAFTDNILKILHYAAKTREIIVGGWDSKENWFFAFAFPKKKLGIMVESSCYESMVTGLRGLLKKIFLSRIATAYCGGVPHKELMLRLGFKGEIRMTGGVGLIRRQPQSQYEPRKTVSRFLYVGRLVAVKNLELLIDVFNELPDLHLDIIGFGVLEEELKQLASKNISFLGAIDNAALGAYYQVSDVFVLPSTSEPWGLVVEEALNNGCPVIVSDKVGCKDDLVSAETGLVFEHSSKESLKEAIKKMCDVNFYNRLRLGVSKLDFEKRERAQIEAFL